MPSKALPELLAALATQYEEDAKALRRAIAIYAAHQSGRAESTFEQKIAAATTLLQKRELPSVQPRPAALEPQIVHILKHGPQNYSQLHEHLPTYKRNQIVKAVSNLKEKGRLRRTGARGKERISLKSRATSVPAENNGHSRHAVSSKGRVFPVTKPASLNNQQKKSLGNYLVYQVAQQANGPFGLEDLTASLKPLKIEATGALLGAAARHGIIKRAPDSHTRGHKTYVLDSQEPPKWFRA